VRSPPVCPAMMSLSTSSKVSARQRVWLTWRAALRLKRVAPSFWRTNPQEAHGPFGVCLCFGGLSPGDQFVSEKPVGSIPARAAVRIRRAQPWVVRHLRRAAVAGFNQVTLSMGLPVAPRFRFTCTPPILIVKRTTGQVSKQPFSRRTRLLHFDWASCQSRSELACRVAICGRAAKTPRTLHSKCAR
jgi:hypothetical protein